MAEQNSYVTGVGSYPVAPDTSVNAFFSSNPHLDNKHNRTLLAGGEGRNNEWFWNSSEAQNLINSYSQFVTNLNNQYDADKKNWETRYNTPLNQSELLESAGYNRNWLQGAANSNATSSDYMPSGGSPTVKSDPMAQIGEMINFSESVLNTFLGFAKGEAEVDNIQANTNLIKEKAITEQEMRPFNMAPKYYGAMKAHNEMYGSVNELFHMPFTPSSGITYQGIPSDSYYNNMLGVKLSAAKLYNQGLQLNNSQKSYVRKTLMPIQYKLSTLQRDYLQGQLSLQQFDLGLRRAVQPAMLKYAPKTPAQQYIQGWINTGLNVIKTGANIFFDFKNFNKMLDFDLFKADGDFGHLDRWY